MDLLMLFMFFFFLTSEGALSAIFQTKRLVSIRIKATDYFLQVVKLHEFDRQSDPTSVFQPDTDERYLLIHR